MEINFVNLPVAYVGWDDLTRRNLWGIYMVRRGRRALHRAKLISVAVFYPQIHRNVWVRRKYP